MADNTLKTRLLSAYNTTAFWSTCTIVPLSGEVCYGVDDNNKILEIKIGNGIDTYAQLPAQSFDNEDHLYQLATPVSTAADGTKFTATTYLKVNNGNGGSSYSNSSSAVLTIPGVSSNGAGVMSTADKSKLDNLNVKDVTYNSSNRQLVVDRYTGNDTTVTFGTAAFASTVNSISDSASLPSASAVKTYVDSQIANATHFCGGFAATGDGAIDGGSTTLKSVAEKVGDMYTVTTAGTYLGIAFEVGDSIIFQKAVAAGTSPTTADFITVEGETSVSVVDNNPTLAWSTRSTVGTVEGTALTVTMPANPDKHTYLTSSNFTNTPASASVKLGIQTSGTSAAKAETTISGATTGAAGVMTTAQVATLNKVISATTGVEGLTKKPSGTAPIAVSADNVISHNNSGVTAGTYGDGTHVSKITVDAKGHITSATTVVIPSATSAAEGLTKKPTGTAPISVSADNVISHDNSGVTAGVYGAAQTASFAGNVAIPSIKVDAKGHVTTAGTVNVKMPSTAGLGTSAKDVKTVLFKANTNSGNTANDFGVVLTFNDNTTASSVITNTLILDGNFTS